MLVILAALPVCAWSLDPARVGAGIITINDTPVFQTPQNGQQGGADGNPRLLALNMEVAILTGGNEWVEIAYYAPSAYERKTGWVRAANVMNLSSHLTPGPNYVNIHNNADVLDSPRPTGSLLGRLAENERVDVVASTSEWVQIVFSNFDKKVLGWIRRSYVVPLSTPIAPSPTPSVTDPSLVTPNGDENPLPGVMPGIPDVSPTPPATMPSVTPPPRENLDYLTTKGAAHTVTLNAPNPEAPTPLRRTANEYAARLGDYYNGVIGEYIAYDDDGWVQVRIGTAVGFFPADCVWVDAPPEIIPSAIPSARVVVMSSHLNVRQYPNINAVNIGQLLGSTEFDVLAKSGEWLHIRTNDLVGYVAAKYTTHLTVRYVDPRTIPKNPEFRGELGSPLVMDETYDTSPNGQDADIEQVEWTDPAVTVDPVYMPPVEPIRQDAHSYSPSNIVPKLPRYAIVRNPSGGMLNLRQGPSTDSLSLGLYYNGVRVAIDASYDDKWVRVSVGLTSGYMSLDYLQITDVPSGNSYTYPQTVPRSTLTSARGAGSGLVLHAAPSDLSDYLASYSSGTTVTILGEYGSWLHVYIQGRIGYVRHANVSRY